MAKKAAKVKIVSKATSQSKKNVASTPSETIPWAAIIIHSGSGMVPYHKLCLSRHEHEKIYKILYKKVGDYWGGFYYGGELPVMTFDQAKGFFHEVFGDTLPCANFDAFLKSLSESIKVVEERLRDANRDLYDSHNYQAWKKQIRRKTQHEAASKLLKDVHVFSLSKFFKGLGRLGHDGCCYWDKSYNILFPNATERQAFADFVYTELKVPKEKQDRSDFWYNDKCDVVLLEGVEEEIRSDNYDHWG